MREALRPLPALSGIAPSSHRPFLFLSTKGAAAPRGRQQQRSAAAAPSDPPAHPLPHRSLAALQVRPAPVHTRCSPLPSFLFSAAPRRAPTCHTLYTFSAIYTAARRSHLQVLELVGIPLRPRDVTAVVNAALACRTLYKLTVAEAALDDDGCESASFFRRCPHLRNALSLPCPRPPALTHAMERPLSLSPQSWLPRFRACAHCPCWISAGTLLAAREQSISALRFAPRCAGRARGLPSMGRRRWPLTLLVLPHADGPAGRRQLAGLAADSVTGAVWRTAW